VSKYDFGLERREANHVPLSPLSFLSFCREKMAGFKLPKTVVFGELPKTSTGKIQKFVLRERVAEL